MTWFNVHAHVILLRPDVFPRCSSLLRFRDCAKRWLPRAAKAIPKDGLHDRRGSIREDKGSLPAARAQEARIAARQVCVHVHTYVHILLTLFDSIVLTT